MPIINMEYNDTNDNVSNLYKYKVTNIQSREQLNKIMDYGIHIISIELRDYNDEINKLPHSLKSLIISGHNFNQSLDKLPQSLKILTISGAKFNQSLDNLPQSLKSLTINNKKMFNIYIITKKFDFYLY